MSEIPKRPAKPAATFMEVVEENKHEHAVAKALWEAVHRDVFDDDTGDMDFVKFRLRKILEDVLESGWAP